jgi:hypothetical protein
MPANLHGFRKLDCAVFETLHAIRNDNPDEFPPYDTVRGVFIEGPELYPGTTIRSKDPIQICVRTESCILGYFRPLNA